MYTNVYLFLFFVRFFFLNKLLQSGQYLLNFLVPIYAESFLKGEMRSNKILF